ncbi:MAG: hypothetical protein OEZ65_04055 [Gemmatimonadota bacterium]|nr:hypothetical protein [Gemmatimonadota bacterium]
MTRRTVASLRGVAPILLAAGVLAGCSGPEADPSQGADQGDAGAPTGNFRGRSYERNFVFTNISGDSALMIPWLTTSQTRPGAVDRRVRGFLFRGGNWDPFYDEAWETAPTRAPWRILPHDHFHLIVGQADAVDAISYDDGVRQLDLEMGQAIGEWTGSRGQTFRIQIANMVLSDQRVRGMMMEMARTHTADGPPPGDWAFLVSGDSLQVVLEGSETHSVITAGSYQGWGSLDGQSLQWPSMNLEWADVGAFQPARQDVPVAWRLSTQDNSISGRFEVRSAHIVAGEGAGPVLPVDALYQVDGRITVAGRNYPVRGLVRHTRP